MPWDDKIYYMNTNTSNGQKWSGFVQAQISIELEILSKKWGKNIENYSQLEFEIEELAFRIADEASNYALYNMEDDGTKYDTEHAQ